MWSFGWLHRVLLSARRLIDDARSVLNDARSVRLSGHCATVQFGCLGVQHTRSSAWCAVVLTLCTVERSADYLAVSTHADSAMAARTYGQTIASLVNITLDLGG